MKRCPRCGQTYSDATLNFCLEDGELLNYLADDAPKTLFADERPAGFADDSPPTVVMSSPRVTNQTNWPGSSPPAWQGGQQNLQNQPYGIPSFSQSKDQTLPTISLVLGIIACVMVCCYGGLWLGVPAAIVGFLGMRNADNHPDRYTGRGMAIGGMVLGIITLLASMVFLIIGLLAG